MKIALGADHRGYLLKEKLKQFLEKLGHEVTDFGADSDTSVDYPDYGGKVARAVAEGTVDRGITICWTGNGMNMVVNKLPEVRGAFAFSEEMARLTREHNDSNVLSLAAKWQELESVEKIVQVWLTTEFEGGRHIPRIKKFSILK
jgi:ribose 5-phosphate isomerase B